MAKAPKKQVVSKKHLARIERERMQTRYIIIGSLIVISLVVILVGYGILEQFFLQPRQSVAKIGDKEITTREFQTYARYSRFQLVQQYLQTQEFMNLLGGSDPTYLLQTYQQVSFQLEPTTLGQTVLDRLFEDHIVRLEADRLGISVTDEEIDQAIEALFRYYPEGMPTPTVTPERKPTSTLSPTQLALIPPTPTATTEVVTDSETTQATPGVTSTPTAFPSPTPTREATPTATPYTREAFEANYNEYINYLDSEVTLSVQDLRWILEIQLFREKVMDSITANVSREQDQVWARHILVEDENTAQEVMTRLQNGEDFATLATELSTDPGSSAQGGDLGWFGLGVMTSDFEKVAFNLNIGQISSPVQTEFGWHVIQVLGHEMRQISESEYQQLRQQTFQEWLDLQLSVLGVEISDLWENRVPTQPSLPPPPQSQ